MKINLRGGLVAAAMLAVFTPAFAQLKTDNTPIETKEQAHARMSVLQDEITQQRNNGAHSQYIGRLEAELEALSLWLGGDVPARTGASVTSTSTSGSQLLSGPACGASTTTTNFAGTTGIILPVPPAPSTVTFTTSVSGMGTYLWDLNLNTTITHPNPTDLDMTLTSPAGTVVVISTDNGGASDNVFNGTVWDEQQAGLLNTVVDRVYANNVTSTPLNTEGRMEAFRGEDPNGTWTLSITDDLTNNVGSLNAFSLDVSTIAAPTETTTNFTTSPGLVITTVGNVTYTSSLAVSGVDTFLSAVTLFLELPHTFASDLDMTLTSPLGTVVKISTDNFGVNANVFNGTLFSGDSSVVITDFISTNLVTVPVCGTEGALEAFRGEDPNGSWTLTVVDDATTDGGTLVRWDLNVTTQTAAPAVLTTNFAGTTGALLDFPPAPPATPTLFTNAVTGVGTVLWDVDLTTVIAHTSGADIDMTLTSPAGTVVTITTDNGGTNDNVFNGTLWDSNANDGVMDHVYTNNVAATPLTAEGSLTAFRGEDPNGVWTLTITDDATAADFGSNNGWSLDITTIAALPVETLTTVTQSPALAISATGTPTVTDSMVVAGAGTALSSMTLYLEIQHTFCSDLDITLTSPGGTVLNVTSDNGGGNNDVFNGTTFDWDSTDSVTDHVYANVVIATPLSPETGMDNLLGQDPNGAWTLTVFDDANLDGGTLVRWDLNIFTCPTNGSAFCSNSSLGVDHTTACPCGNVGAPGNGCGHSFDPNGANMSVTGTIAADDIVLHSQFEPASSFTLMMQHGNAGDVVFHDGVLCAANPLIRLRGRSAVGGEAFFPNSLFANDSTTTLSARGGTFPGSGATMRYAAWYRNASTTFCPPATANVTNGWVITW